jgi:hypothetical protein
MLNFVVNLLENERSGPMNDQDHSLSLSDPDRSLVLSHFLTNFLQNLASCHTAFNDIFFYFIRNGLCLVRGNQKGLFQLPKQEHFFIRLF